MADLSGRAMDTPIKKARLHGLVKYSTILAIILSAIFGVSKLFPDRGSEVRLNNVSLETSKIRMEAFTDSVSIRTRVVPKETVFLDSVSGGTVQTVLVKDGANVKAGDPILTLSNVNFELQMARSVASVTGQLSNNIQILRNMEQRRLELKIQMLEADLLGEKLEREIQRGEKLKGVAGVSVSSIKDRRSDLAYNKKLRALLGEAIVQEAKLETRQIDLVAKSRQRLEESLKLLDNSRASTHVKAPISGRLSGFDVRVGQNVADGSRIGQIDTSGGYLLNGALDEFYLPKISLGEGGEADVDGRVLNLKVVTIDPEVVNGSFNIDLAVIDDSPPKMRRGRTVPVRIKLSATSRSLIVDRGPFIDFTAGRWVFVLDDDGRTARRRPVSLGRRTSTHIEVLEGLDDGDIVITSSYAAFGDKKTIVFSEEDS